MHFNHAYKKLCPLFWLYYILEKCTGYKCKQDLETILYKLACVSLQSLRMDTTTW